MDMDQIRMQADIVAVIRARVPLTQRGREFVALCPFHEETTPSFYVVPDRQFFHCFGCGANGDVVAFVQKYDGVPFKEAVAAVQGDAAPQGVRPVRQREATPDQDWVTEPPPPTAQRPGSLASPYHGEPVAEWCYRSRDGAVLGYAARYMVLGKKAILQWTYGRGPGEREAHWACRHFSKPRPLYGLERLGDAGLVMIVEGEKTADAAQRLYPHHRVLSWPGGTSGAKHADWSVLAGRSCVMVPDADAPGLAAGEWIQRTLTAIGCRVDLVQPEPTRPSGWDLADAEAEGWTEAEAEAWLDGLLPEASEVAVPLAPSSFSEDALAQQFVVGHAEDVKYVKAWGQWMLWSGHRWTRDEQGAIMEKIRAMLCGVVNSEAGLVMLESARRKINSLHAIRAVEALASFAPAVATTPGQWDTDPWLLSTPGGTVDLRTGTLRSARREDYATQTASVTPADAACPTWMQFLDTAMDHDQDLIAYLQRLMGYALTGSTREQHLSFFYGTGGNGKGVFLSTVRAILGEYAAVAPMTTFTEAKVDRHPTEIAGLRGARLVVAQETEEGRKWAEGLIKSLTGGDPITARFMRQDYFEFVPTFKLLFAGNHKPALRSVDEAMRRRMHIVPWTVTIPAEKRDHTLGEKLKGEYGAILFWMIEGCLAWQQQGLTPPESILHATDEYLQAEDPLLAWIEECCVLGREHAAPSKEVYQNYVAWCDDAKEYPMSHKRLINNLVGRGCQSLRVGGVRSLAGIGLNVVTPVPTW